VATPALLRCFHLASKNCKPHELISKFGPAKTAVNLPAVTAVALLAKDFKKPWSRNAACSDIACQVWEGGGPAFPPLTPLPLWPPFPPLVGPG
jgi:hypothetical protein